MKLLTAVSAGAFALMTMTCTSVYADPQSVEAAEHQAKADYKAAEKQAKFDEKYGLGFTLLADTEHAVAEKYGVWGEKVNYGRKYMGIIRSAFVVDATGKLAGVFYKISPKDTVPKVTKVLEELG